MKGVACVVLLVACGAGPAEAGWVVGGYVGVAETARTYLTLAQPASRTAVRFDDIDYEGRSFQLPLYYGYRAAWFPGTDGWLGLEGEVIHMKVYAKPGQHPRASGTVGGAAVSSPFPLDTLVQRFSLSHGQNLLLVNVVARHAFGECGDSRKARLVAVARVGAGPTLPHVESTVGGVADERYEWGRAGLQAAGGFELRLWKDLHALAEYKVTRCRQSVSAAAGSTIETLLTTHHVVFGAAWAF